MFTNTDIHICVCCVNIIIVFLSKRKAGNLNKGERVKAEARLAREQKSKRERAAEERLKAGQKNKLPQGTISGVTKLTKGHEKKKRPELRKLP